MQNGIGSTTVRASRPDTNFNQADEALRRATRPAATTTPDSKPVAPGDMRVWIEGPSGRKTQPLRHAMTGGAVEATVYVRSIQQSRGGRAHGLVGNNTGTAIFTVDGSLLPRLSTLRAGAMVTIRGTVTRVDRIPTIRVMAAQAVNA